ncbi:hypothetical protein ABEB36_012549 [Hypothenemus hampei]|uniref:Prothoracicotropic hormone n=1 Tax=Hypothenemus hampei TaxID=57062 RepID=A0ABD1EBV4_HYPHA
MLCDGDLIDAITCGVFNYCDEDDINDDNVVDDDDDDDDDDITKGCFSDSFNFFFKNKLKNMVRAYVKMWFAFDKICRTFQKRTIKKKSSISSLYDPNLNVPCQCEMSYRLMDLGSSRYPRYIHTGVCKKNSCGLFHRCQAKKYKIRVLKKRDPDTEFLETESQHLPESLAENWMPDFVNIVIGCECVPNTK